MTPLYPPPQQSSINVLGAPGKPQNARDKLQRQSWLGLLPPFGQILNHWHIPDVACKITFNQLGTVQLPFIACFIDKQYAVVTRIDEEQVAVYGMDDKSRLLDITGFKKLWSGFILASQKDAIAGRVNVSMPELSAIELTGIFNVYTKMLFIAAGYQFTKDAFEREIFNYMLKPVADEGYLKFIIEYKRQLKKGPEPFKDYFYITDGAKDKYISLNVNEIIYVEGDSNYITIHTQVKNIMPYLTLQEMEERLPPDAFTRIHRSYIIADDRIEAIDGNTVKLRDVSEALDIGRTYRAAFFEKIEKRAIRSKRVH